MPVAAGWPHVALTNFVGREQEIVAIRRSLSSTRLLTLTGAGGSGKTRLASEVVEQSAASYPDGVVWVELAPVQDPALLPESVLAAIGAEQGSRPAMQALLDVLRERAALLVLDNCEHLVRAAAELVETLLRATPTLRVLTTSREALGVGGERAWLVPGLSLPDADAPLGAIADAEAVKLFVDRAQSALATFEITRANAPAIARICRRLDGLPLAIELAAARVRSLTPAQLAERLDDVFRILTSGSRTAVARHRTLREAIDWSYRLLDARERLLLQRLSTFAGDIALEQIEAVCSDDDLDPRDVLDTIAALVDKSLVVTREAGGTARYQLLETIRQFAAEKLTESGAASVVALRHATAYVDLVEEAAPHFITRERPLWVARVQRELDNVRVALAFTRASRPADHVRLVGRLGWFWYSSGLWTEGRRWLEGAIAISNGEIAVADHATNLFGAGVIASLQADHAVATRWLEESAASFRSIGDQRAEAYALAYLGIAAVPMGVSARAPVEQALEWFRDADDLYGLRLAHVVLSTHHLIQGEMAEARRHADAGASVARAFGLDRELAIALQVYGLVVLTAGDLPHAGELFREALAALRRDPSAFWIARALELLGIVICRTGDPERGVVLLGAADACRVSIGAAHFAHDRDRLEPITASARETLGVETFARRWSEGSTRSLDDVLAEAIEPLSLGADAESAAAPAAEPTAPALDVRALGALVIVRDGAPLPNDAWRYARPRELLLYLLAHPEGRTRDQIGLVFWPDASTAQVKNNFHVTLHHLRKALGSSDLIAFESDRYRVAWEAGVRFDARELEEAIAPAMRALRSARADADTSRDVERIRGALALYRGDFLQDEGAGDWHLEIRDRLRRLYAAALLMVGEHLARGGDHAEAAEAYRRVIAVEELHEEAHRRLMLALARGGERSEALRQYERLVGALRRDLDAEPDAETKALFERLRRAEAV